MVPVICNLGTHDVLIDCESVEITTHTEGERVQLDRDEAYKLYVSLHALFTQLSQEN